jgi:hypothetical protein
VAEMTTKQASSQEEAAAQAERRSGGRARSTQADARAPARRVKEERAASSAS